MNIIVIKCTLGAAFSFLCPNIFPFPAHRDAIGSDMRYTRTAVIIIIKASFYLVPRSFIELVMDDCTTMNFQYHIKTFLVQFAEDGAQ